MRQWGDGVCRGLGDGTRLDTAGDGGRVRRVSRLISTVIVNIYF